MTISSPPGTPIGYIEQQWHPFLPKFNILDEQRDVILKIEGPLCAFSFCGDVEFKVSCPIFTPQQGGVLS